MMRPVDIDQHVMIGVAEIRTGAACFEIVLGLLSADDILYRPDGGARIAPDQIQGCKKPFARAAGRVIVSRSVFQFLANPKFKDERNMPFTKNQTEDRSELRTWSTAGEELSLAAFW